jgi:putative ABC transport system substrate-binding protein
MRRREFIAGLGSAAAWPLAARAQQPAPPLVGWLGMGSSPDDARELITAAKQGLAETGFVEGRNFAFEYRWADYHPERLPGLAADSQPQSSLGQSHWSHRRCLRVDRKAP